MAYYSAKSYWKSIDWPRKDNAANSVVLDMINILAQIGKAIEHAEDIKNPVMVARLRDGCLDNQKPGKSWEFGSPGRREDCG